MNKLMLFSLAVAMAFAVRADEQPAPVDMSVPVATTLFSDGSTNVWTQADLLAALQLMNRKYHREVETPSGRVAWHGRLVSQIVDTNACVKTEIYADGTRFEFPFEPVAPAKKPKTTLNANGVPPALAEARARRAAEKATTNVVTVISGPDAATPVK